MNYSNAAIVIQHLPALREGTDHQHLRDMPIAITVKTTLSVEPAGSSIQPARI